MKKKVNKKTLSKKTKVTCCSTSSCGSGAYFLGMIGAAVYYIQTATGFWDGVLGILKAIVWPAFLVYKLFGV